MAYSSIGDLAHHFQMRRNNTDLQRTMVRLTAELTSGRRSDVAASVSGDFSALAAFDQSLVTLSSYRTATTEAQQFATAVQTVLGTLQDTADLLMPTMLSTTIATGASQVDTLAIDARQRLATTLAHLNTQVAGRYVLAGAATDTRPVADDVTIIAALQTATAGLATAQEVSDAVSAWFDAPAGGGGFRDIGYAGSTVPAGPFRIAEGEDAGTLATAADTRITDVLKGLATMSLIAAGTFAGNTQGRAALTHLAGQALASSGAGLTELRAETGSLEARIDAAERRNAAEATTLEISRTGLLAADPYETATALEDVQRRIETLYTVTARMSRLSLAEFLR